MSDRLSVSSALSVLLMAGYALLSPDAVHVPLGPDSAASAISITAPDLPSVSVLLPSLR